MCGCVWIVRCVVVVMVVVGDVDVDVDGGIGGLKMDVEDVLTDG